MSDLLDAPLARWMRDRWRPEIGAIDGYDALFLARLFERVRPRRIVELGCASGFSTAVLAYMLDKSGGGRIDSFDIASRFYADPTCPVGYLVEDAPSRTATDIQIHAGTTALDVEALLGGDSIDLCFIDACHSHPWPTIDTLSVLPHVRVGGVIVHHDLKMYADEQLAVPLATGPKVLWDQIPPKAKIWFGDKPEASATRGFPLRHIWGNIGAIAVPEKRNPLAWCCAQAFYLGWDGPPFGVVPDSFAKRFADTLAEREPSSAAKAFEIGLARYNDRSRTAEDASERVRSRRERALRRLRHLTGRA